MHSDRDRKATRNREGQKKKKTVNILNDLSFRVFSIQKQSTLVQTTWVGTHTIHKLQDRELFHLQYCNNKNSSLPIFRLHISFIAFPPFFYLFQMTTNTIFTGESE